MFKGSLNKNWTSQKRILQLLVEFVRILSDPDDSKLYDKRNQHIYELWQQDRPTYLMKAQTLAENLKMKISKEASSDQEKAYMQQAALESIASAHAMQSSATNFKLDDNIK